MYKKAFQFIKRFWPVLLVVVILFFIIRTFTGKSEAKLLSAKLGKNPKVVAVEKRNLQQFLTLAGQVDAEKSTTLQFQTAGKLAWVGVKEGDLVKKGQAIASLDQNDLKKRFEKTLNDYLTNRWTFEDTQDEYRFIKENYLLTDEIRRILDRKQFSLNNAVLDLELTDIALKNATLISPIDGIVTHIDQPLAGVNIIPTGATFTVVDPSNLYFRSEIDEEDVIKVKPKQDAQILIDSYPDKIIDSKITSISFSPIEGQTSIVYRIKFSLPASSSATYRLGMNGDAKIILASFEKATSIPIEALIEENNEKYVIAKDEKTNRPVKKIVKIGIETDDFVQITEGLEENQKIFIPSGK